MMATPRDRYYQIHSDSADLHEARAKVADELAVIAEKRSKEAPTDV